ncbi:MAG: DUF1259 domain-containing protein [Methyloceanibacter sp.]
MQAETDWTKVDAALGKTALVQGGVHRYGIPRTDLQVTLDGVAIKPALALGGWLGFEPVQDGAVVMGDLVLTEVHDPALAPGASMSGGASRDFSWGAFFCFTQRGSNAP